MKREPLAPRSIRRIGARRPVQRVVLLIHHLIRYSVHRTISLTGDHMFCPASFFQGLNCYGPCFVSWLSTERYGPITVFGVSLSIMD